MKTTKTIRPTPLNRNGLLWHLFERAQIPMPAAEAWEYAEIEREEGEKKVLNALLAEMGRKDTAKVEAQIQGIVNRGEREHMPVETAKELAMLVGNEACHWCGCTEPLDTSYSDEGHGWPFCPRCHGV